MKKIKEFLDNVKIEYLLITIFLLILIVIALIVFPINKKVEVENAPLLEVNQEEKVEIKKVRIDIKGNVANPGVYELEENSRVIDAINIAGGLLENSNTELINLSQKLTDEMVIIVYTNAQIEQYKKDKVKTEYVYIEVEVCPDKINDACINKQLEKVNNETTNKDKIDSKKDESNISDNTTSKISINKATKEELKTLTGIGDSKATDIIKYREQNGNFNNIEDIKKVSGIGDALFEKIKDSITI